MNVHTITDLDDPRLAPYRAMKEKELARDGDRFIAEGSHLVCRLLSSGLGVDSVLMAERKVASQQWIVPSDVPFYIASDSVIERVIGFAFHSGVLACGVRPPSPTLQSLMRVSPEPVTISVCQQITSTENLGSLIRISAGLGAHFVLLGERCCDPFFRQSVRVSMGAVFRLPIVRSRNLLEDLAILRQQQIVTWAATLDEDVAALNAMPAPPRIAIVFGNEADGLDAATIAACDQRVTIPMSWQTDSLNVAAAAAIFLHQVRRPD